MTPRQFCTPHIVRSGTIVALQREPLGAKGLDEAALQRMLFEHPALLPVDDIEPLFAPLTPLARELPTPAGPVDVVYLNAEGYITLVETKLWRNPEARRQVVAQIIDYATAMSKWSYEDLSDAARRAGATGGDPLSERFRALPEFDEARFADTVGRSLQRGRFLLLIVGDGIHESVEHLADTMSRSPHLGFSLALVELAMFRVPGSEQQILVQPRTVARTREVVRAVVELRGGVSVSNLIVSLPADDESVVPRRRVTEEAVLEEIGRSTTPAVVEPLRAFVRAAEDLGIRLTCKGASIGLWWFEPNTDDRFTFGSVYAASGDADFWFVRDYFQKAAVDDRIARAYLEAVAALVPGGRIRDVTTKKGVGWRVLAGDRPVNVADLMPRSADWLASIQRAMQQIETVAAQAKHTRGE